MFTCKAISHVRTMTRRSVTAPFTRVAVLVTVLFASFVAIAPSSAAANYLSVGIVGTVMTETGSPHSQISSFNGTLGVEVTDVYGNVVYPSMFGSNFVLSLPANNWYYFRAYGIQGKCGNGIGVLLWEGGGWVYVGDTATSVNVWTYPTWQAC